MTTVSQHIRRRLLFLGKLGQSEWSYEFEELMRNRLIMGAFRYGKLRAPGKPQFDRVAYAIRCLEQFRQTGNLEHLVDAANLCLVEFVEGKHPHRHFAAVDGGDHAEKVLDAAEKVREVTTDEDAKVLEGARMDRVLRPPTVPPEGVDLTETRMMQAIGKRLQNWNGLCVLCGGWGPFRKPKDSKYEWTDVCAWCHHVPDPESSGPYKPLSIAEREDYPKAPDGGPK